MARIRLALGVLIPLGVIGGAAAMGRSILRQRRNPEPFPARRARVLDNPIARRQAGRIVELLDLVPGMRVLDVGAGIGRLSIPIAVKVGPEGEVVALPHTGCRKMPPGGASGPDRQAIDPSVMPFIRGGF
ncbi:MAG TPA: hypothetical protein VKL22_06735 [Actinomycetota bacterium]|nr:hypothetical protein [Actinomycetota bacterium]